MSQKQNTPHGLASKKHQAIALAHKGELEQARNILEPLWLTDELDAEGCLLRGSIVKRLGLFEEAVDSYRKSVELEPGVARAHFGLGMLYLAWRKPGLAENHLRNTISTNPKHSGAHYQLGCLLYRQGHMRQAETEFNQVIELNPAHINACKSLADLLMSMNQHEQAKAIFEKALSLQPGNLDVLAGLGKLYCQTGEIQKAFDLVMPHIEQGVKNPALGLVFAGLPWDDQVLKFYEPGRNAGTASYDQVRQKMYTHSTRRWKNYEKHLGSLVNALGLQDRSG